jgi:hypothetical protein
MGLLDNIGNKLSSMSDDDKRGMALNLASGFAGMSGNPNTNSIMAGIEGQKAALAARREKTNASDKQAAMAAQALKLLGTTYPDIAQAIQGGFMSPKEGMAEVMRRKNLPAKERKIVKGADDYNYYADDASRVLGDVTATPKDNRTIQQKNYEYWIEKGLTDEQAKAQSKSGQTINIGGENQTAGRKKVDEAYAADYLQWTQGGGSDMTGQLAQIGTVLGQLEAGESLTGPAIGMLGSYSPMALSIINPKAANAKEQVEEVVQRNLRVVLGAQFTAQEGERLISRAYNPALPPKQNASRLRKLFMQMEAAAKQRDSMASYFGTNGTLIGYDGKQPSINDFYSAISGFSVGQVVNGYAFMGGDPTIKANWSEQ